MYGDAPLTVSVSIVTVAVEVPGKAGRLFLTNGSRYVNLVGSSGSTSATFVEML